MATSELIKSMPEIKQETLVSFVGFVEIWCDESSETKIPSNESSGKHTL